MAPAVYEGVFDVPNGIIDTFLKANQFTKVSFTLFNKNNLIN